jgi:hypothetical protein
MGTSTAVGGLGRPNGLQAASNGKQIATATADPTAPGRQTAESRS